MAPKALVLVTGGTSGIGFGIASQLVKQDIDLILTYRSNKDKAFKAKQALLQINSNCNISLIDGDMADDKVTDKYIKVINDLIQNNDNKLIGVVHNAGLIFNPSELPHPGTMDFDNQHHKKILDMFTKLYGFQFMKLLEKGKDIMIRNNDNFHNGSFIFISSPGMNSSGKNAWEYYLAPGSGKTLGEYYCRVYGRSFTRYKINVNCIVPGVIKTPPWQNLPRGLLEDTVKKVPMQRDGKPDEVGYLASFLLSKQAAYITGETIRIDGGNHLGLLNDEEIERWTSIRSKL